MGEATDNNVSTEVSTNTIGTTSTTSTQNPITDASNFEKFVLGFSTLATVLTILGVYIWKGIVDSNLIYLTTIEVSAFVARKGLKYHYEYGGISGDTDSPNASIKREKK